MKKQLKDREVEMELSDEMAQKFRDTFNLEIEMLNGTQEKLSGGKTRYRFFVSQEKGELIKSFILKTIINVNNINMN